MRRFPCFHRAETGDAASAGGGKLGHRGARRSPTRLRANVASTVVAHLALSRLALSRVSRPARASRRIRTSTHPESKNLGSYLYLWGMLRPVKTRI